VHEQQSIDSASGRRATEAEPDRTFASDMVKGEFRERLLGIMEKKQHWAWPAFSNGLVPRALLNVHLEQEYATYVRDFPVLVARAYVNCPIAEVRGELIENVFEEETGKLQAGRPHPELFLEYPRGLGMDLGRFERVELLPGAARYRAFLDEATLASGWEVAAAVTTIFVEGTSYERGELDADAPRRPVNPFEEHPLVKHYGLPLENLALARAHRAVEGFHRAGAWRVVLDFVAVEARARVVSAMAAALELWLGYRDDVARACGLERGADGSIRLRPQP
jgi:pyrroloquinoline quinone (PQQ) biosynthesis protein C